MVLHDGGVTAIQYSLMFTLGHRPNEGARGIMDKRGLAGWLDNVKRDCIAATAVAHLDVYVYILLHCIYISCIHHYTINSRPRTRGGPGVYFLSFSVD